MPDELRTVVGSDGARQAARLGQPLHQRVSTLAPVIDVSISIATHSRVQSSTMFKQRSLRPSARPSDTKSVGQLWFASSGFGKGLLLDDSDALPLATPHRQARIAIQAVDPLTVPPQPSRPRL